MQHDKPFPTFKAKVARALTLHRRLESRGHKKKRIQAAIYNDSAPISRLPPELLSHIFLFCVSSSFEVGNDPKWLVVTRVCQTWREAAMACPEFWANLIFRGKLAPLMLARSKTVPLSIRVDLDSNKRFTPKLIHDNIARIGALDIRGSQAAVESFFSPYADEKVAAPVLTNLSVTNYALNTPLWLDAQLFQVAEGRGVSRQLRLEQCALPWNSPWYTNLTYLYLADLHGAQGPTLTALFAAIIASPRLQELHLLNTNIQLDDWERFPAVELKDLRAVHLSDPISVCSRLLKNLIFPSIVSIGVTCLPDSIDSRHRSFASAVIHRDFWAQYTSLRIEAPMGSFLRLCASSVDTDKTLRLEIHTSSPQPLVEPVLQSFKLIRPADIFAHVVTLHIDLPFLGVDSWRYLSQCCNLRTLTLQNTNPYPIFSLLLERAMRCIGVSRCQDIKHLDARGSCEQLFPDLHRLKLKAIECGKPKTFPTVTDILRSLLWARRAGRCPISVLQLDKCENLFKQDTDHLNMLAEEFIWDGKGANTEEKEDGGYFELRSFSMNVFEFVNLTAHPGLDL